MMKGMSVPNQRLSSENPDLLLQRASDQWEKGNLKTAFRLSLKGALLGESSCQLNVGTFYESGRGVKRDRDQALFRYRRAYRRGESSGAHNIGNLLLKENKSRQAIQWFEKAIGLGDASSNLDIAKIHLQAGEITKAVPYLKKVLKAKSWEPFGGDREEARRLYVSKGASG